MIQENLLKYNFKLLQKVHSLGKLLGNCGVLTTRCKLMKMIKYLKDMPGVLKNLQILPKKSPEIT